MLIFKQSRLFWSCALAYMKDVSNKAQLKKFLSCIQTWLKYSTNSKINKSCQKSSAKGRVARVECGWSFALFNDTIKWSLAFPKSSYSGANVYLDVQKLSSQTSSEESRWSYIKRRMGNPSSDASMGLIVI